MRARRVLAIAGFVAMCLPATATADPITFVVFGTVDRYLSGGAPAEVPVGSAFQMVLTWESDTPATEVSPGSATYVNALLRAAISPGSLDFSLSDGGTSRLGVVNGLAEDYDRLVGIIDSQTNGTTWHSRWEILFPSTAWDTTALPNNIATALNSGFAKLYWNSITGNDIGLEATITHAYSVAEPSTLLLVGLGALAASRFRRRRASRP